jgi:hypothetical protein
MLKQSGPYRFNDISWISIGMAGAACLCVAMVGHFYSPSVARGQAGQRVAAQEAISTYLQTGELSSRQLARTFEKTDRLVRRLSADAGASQVPLAEVYRDPFSGDATADSKPPEQDRVAMLEALEKLQLQSVCAGDRPSCMIDNRQYHEGEEVACFAIERIGREAVVIRNGGYRFELKISG